MADPFLPPAQWLSGTNQNSVPANDNALRFEISQRNVNNATTAQPVSPSEGDTYIIQLTHTGTQWATFAPKDVAIYKGGTWKAFTPVEGNSVSVNGVPYIYTSGVWTAAGGGGGGGGSGTVADALSVYLNTATNTTAAGWQKTPVDTVSYDTNTIWDSTNKRAVPKKAGYYMVTVRARTASAAALVLAVGRNGAQSLGVGPDGGAVLLASGGSALVYCNGTTDYIEAFTFATAVRAYTLGAFDTYMQVVGPLSSTSTQGKQTIGLNAGSMRPSVTGGCQTLSAIASAANQPDIVTLDFDPTTEEYAQFSIPMPKKWNEGTITARFRWSHAATTTNFGVVWGIQAVAVGDDDPIAVAFGTAQTVTDTGGTTNDLYISAETSAITVGGTPVAGDTVFFRAYRKSADGSDTMAVDARLHGIDVFITTDADTDA